MHKYLVPFFFFLFLILLTPNVSYGAEGAFDASNYYAPANTEFPLVVNATNLVDVGAVEFILEYDPRVVTYVSTAEGPLLAPILDTLDATTSMAVDRERLVVSVLSADFVGISGNGEVATVTFRTSADGGTTTIAMVSMTMIDTFMVEEPILVGPSLSVTVIAPDTTPPVRSSLSPSGELSRGTTQTTISLTTDENATCRYSTSGSADFASMTLFSTTGSTTHSSLVTGLVNGGTYRYYVRCEDTASNTNSDTVSISFSVQASVISSGGGGGGGSSRDTTPPRGTSISIASTNGVLMSHTTTLSLTARDESTPITMQISEDKTFAGEKWITFTEKYTWTFTKGNGNRTLYARFKDAKDNISDPVSDTIELNAQDAPAVVTQPTTVSTPSPVQTTLPRYTFSTSMGIGASGAGVVELQQRLREEGFFTYPTNTGYYGAVTAEAVKRYQAKYGISTTGFVGPLTMGKLNEQTATKPTSQGIDLVAFVRLLLALGIIKQEKADIAFAALASL